MKLPYMLLVEFFDPITSEIAKRPDFRHTLAFAIILTRTRKLDSYLNEYLKLTIKTQNPDGVGIQVRVPTTPKSLPSFTQWSF
ncbi:MAG: hypothetical protein WAT12_09125 [Candidatus Nitrotoga sp.]